MIWETQLYDFGSELLASMYVLACESRNFAVSRFPI
jgi:hypothetical protein